MTEPAVVAVQPSAVDFHSLERSDYTKSRLEQLKKILQVKGKSSTVVK